MFKTICPSFTNCCGIYARENGQGLFFDPEEYANVAPVEDKLDSETQETSEPTKKKPTLRILD
ncbi:stringent starvation B family protein [Acinetobacter baumannii 987421]|nr:stringent starvation B family protein [Acinetobacter baumannii 987421]